MRLGHSASLGILMNVAFCLLSLVNRLIDTIQLALHCSVFETHYTGSVYTTVDLCLRARRVL